MELPDDDLTALRAEIDRINRRLCDLLQERARCAAAIARLKAARGRPVPDPEREAAMLADVLSEPGEGFDAAALGRIFRAVFDESRALARRVAGDG